MYSLTILVDEERVRFFAGLFCVTKRRLNVNLLPFNDLRRPGNKRLVAESSDYFVITDCCVKIENSFKLPCIRTFC